MTQNLKAIKGKIYTFKDIFLKGFAQQKKSYKENGKQRNYYNEYHRQKTNIPNI